MKRRDFIKAAAVLAGSGYAGGLVSGRESRSAPLFPEERTNVLLIMTDQQSADALSFRMGSKYIRTPAMDSLAQTGTVFTRAYAANPLCIPSRTSMFTGQCPHVTGIQVNDGKASLAGKYDCLGNIFRNDGYDTGYFGKWHLPYQTTDTACHGFETMAAIKNDGADKELPALAEEFIQRKREHPFLLVTSFVNPHNICEWPRGEVLKNGDIGVPPSLDHCPPAVTNNLPMRNETDAMLLMRRAYQGSEKVPVGDFDEKKWRQYRWAYFRMIEMVDSHIALVLNALRDSKQDGNTLIVFTSDHGDCQGAHGWNQKTVLYDESSRIPFILRMPGTNTSRISDHLVNTGIDLLPTLCDIAGVQSPEHLPGRSVSAAARGLEPNDPRAYIVAEDKLVQGIALDGKKYEPSGRMVRSRQFKYCAFDLGINAESLIDMENDPGETTNLTGRKEYRQVLDMHRGYLSEWCRTMKDRFAVPQ